MLSGWQKEKEIGFLEVCLKWKEGRINLTLIQSVRLGTEIGSCSVERANFGSEKVVGRRFLMNAIPPAVGVQG